MAGKEDSFDRLPFDVRRLVMRLLHDGAQLNEIRRHPEVARALSARKLTFSGAVLSRVRSSPEYQHYVRCREETARRIEADRWAAAALRECAGISSVADMAQMAVLEQLREIAARGSSDPGELLKITTAVSRIKSADAAREAGELRSRLAEAERRSRELEEQLAERDSEIIRLRKQSASGVSPAAVADALDRELGIGEE